MNIQEFLNSNIRNAWLYEKPFNIYARESTRYIHEQSVRCFDVANIENTTAYRGTGKFWQFLAKLDALLIGTNIKLIYIESVLNERLCTSLRAHPDFTEVLRSDPPCFFLVIGEKRTKLPLTS